MASGDLTDLCYASDDQTVAKAWSDLPVARTVVEVAADGVWVQMNLDGRR